MYVHLQMISGAKILGDVGDRRSDFSICSWEPTSAPPPRASNTGRRLIHEEQGTMVQLTRHPLPLLPPGIKITRRDYALLSAADAAAAAVL